MSGNIDWSSLSTAATKAAAVKQAAIDNIAARRYAAETAGVTINGMQVATDRDSRALITGAALSAFIDSTYVCRWKTPEGFIDLDAPTLIFISQSLRDYVQACFDREEALQLLVEKGTYKEYLLEKGWPSVEISKTHAAAATDSEAEPAA
jgi:hypothetical protein